jgi:hypothetical protein
MTLTSAIEQEQRGAGATGRCVLGDQGRRGLRLGSADRRRTRRAGEAHDVARREEYTGPMAGLIFRSILDLGPYAATRLRRRRPRTDREATAK